MGIDPCGWCGRDGCKTQLTQNSKTKALSIVSGCEYHYKGMRYSNAIQCTANSPCTNVPIHCPMCSAALSGQLRTVWKYNAFFHLAAEHGPENGVLPEILPECHVNTFVTSLEERRMGIDAEATSKMRQELKIPDTEGILEMREALKRARGESGASSSSDVERPQRKASRRAK